MINKNTIKIRSTDLVLLDCMAHITIRNVLSHKYIKYANLKPHHINTSNRGVLPNMYRCYIKH